MPQLRNFMKNLREGDSGPDVTTLQNKLNEYGFPVGLIDGKFGDATEAALLAFQRSEGLPADGVFGPRTAAALGFVPAEHPPMLGKLVAEITASLVSKLFPSAPLADIETNLPRVLAALEEANLAYIPMVMVALGTIRAETEGFVPIDEFKSRFNTSPSGAPFDLYDNRKDLGNRGPTDGRDFKGRGFVQLTGRANYAKIGYRIGADLLSHPELANQPDIAAKILAAFIADKEAQIREAISDNDLRAARKLVNGGSHGLAPFSEVYNLGLRLLA
jgi:putative chitinase